MTRRATDPSITVRLDPELIEWLNEEADRRIVGRRLLVEAGLRLLRERLAEPEHRFGDPHRPLRRTADGWEIDGRDMPGTTFG